MAFGVVDGVGGWEESGVDPADFAHSLCDYMADAAGRYPYGSDKQPARGVSGNSGPKPVELLEAGYEKVMEDPGVPAGGCTACIATVTASGTLNVAK
jgi:protein phosphatase PTC7